MGLGWARGHTWTFLFLFTISCDACRRAWQIRPIRDGRYIARLFDPDVTRSMAALLKLVLIGGRERFGWGGVRGFCWLWLGWLACARPTRPPREKKRKKKKKKSRAAAYLIIDAQCYTTCKQYNVLLAVRLVVSDIPEELSNQHGKQG